MTAVPYTACLADERTPASSLRTVELRSQPFRYFLALRCIGSDAESALLDWFETDAPWRLTTTDFYQQYEFSMLDTPLPASVSSLTAPDRIATIRRNMAAVFDVVFDERTRLVAHKLTPRQRIAIHNDHLSGEETHRLIVQLNRGLRDEDGGFFMLFSSNDPHDVHRIIRPASGSGIGFEIGERSNHAVSRLYGGERYTLVYSFFARPRVQRASSPS